MWRFTLPQLRCGAILLWSLVAGSAAAGVGDPQVGTDHPWYGGELTCSTFQRLFETQARLYQHVVGKQPQTDEEKVIAAWLWRNTHFWHGAEGKEDLLDKGFQSPEHANNWTREYWTGLFANGFALCGTTHAQWTAEMHALLGHNRGRAVGVQGHNSFEVFVTGGPYGDGKWVLLDHDLSTIIYDPSGRELLSIQEVTQNVKQLTDPTFKPEKQHGWIVCGLHPGDGGVYQQYNVAEYFPGYSGVPPMVHLRRGEKLRRYFSPGLSDGQTFVFWGQNYNSGGIPGPQRSRTWVNQPEKMYGAKRDAGHIDGQARYANAVYTYRPDFASGDYREGVIDESQQHVTLEFYTPYIIAATPPHDDPWGIYEPGCQNGLVITGHGGSDVEISTDQGVSWTTAGKLDGQLDLTDLAKGHRQYLLRVHAGAQQLASSGLRIRTVCQMNSSIVPQLTDGGSTVDYQSSGQAVFSAGPNRDQVQPYVIDGQFDSPRLTLQLTTPRDEPITEVFAAARVRSSSPPSPDVHYGIEISTDAGKSWRPIVEDWAITRRGQEPDDFWSQSFCYGDLQASEPIQGPVQIRFHNDGGKQYARAEAHLVYQVAHQDQARVTFHWKDDAGEHEHSQVISGGKDRWQVPTGEAVQTQWVEIEPVVKIKKASERHGASHRPLRQSFPSQEAGG